MNWKIFAALGAVLLAGGLVAVGGMKVSDRAEADKTLLASAPVYPGATLVREYLRTESSAVWRGREYATELAPADAASKLSQFYNDKLATDGWQVLEQKGDSTSFKRGTDRLSMTSIGVDLPAPSAGERVVSDKQPPDDTHFFFAIEVSTGAGGGG